MSITRDSLSDGDDFKKVAEVNFQKIRNKSNKIGYADGVSDGHIQTFQAAFDKGYADGFRTGFELEKYRGFFGNFSSFKVQDEELNKEKSQYLKMAVSTATDPSHCRFSENSKESLSVMSNHQNNYVDTFLSKCQQTLPLTSNLLATQNLE